MTEATPLASEQITQEDREALERLDDQLGFLTEVERPIVLEAFARHRIAALSASPAPSGQGVSGEVGKVAQALLIARTWPKHSDNCAYRTIPDSEDGPWPDCNCDLVRNHKLIDDAFAIVEALAAPAPSCAPGEVLPCPNPWCDSDSPPFMHRIVSHREEWAMSCGCGFLGPVLDNPGRAEEAWNSRRCALGEVERLALEAERLAAESTSRIDAAELRGFATGLRRAAALTPAPGATAQDGVDADTLNLRAERAAGNIPSPTPTIPAGMVAWNGGDNAPEDWDGGPVLLRNGETEAPTGDGLDWRHFGTDVHDGHSDIIAYTPLAAAPKQAEQQGVEALRAEFARLHEAARGCEFDLTPADGPIAQLTLFVHENGAAILAALNAPTGAVEKGEAK